MYAANGASAASSNTPTIVASSNTTTTNKIAAVTTPTVSNIRDSWSCHSSNFVRSGSIR